MVTGQTEKLEAGLREIMESCGQELIDGLGYMARELGKKVTLTIITLPGKDEADVDLSIEEPQYADIAFD